MGVCEIDPSIQKTIFESVPNRKSISNEKHNTIESKNGQLNARPTACVPEIQLAVNVISMEFLAVNRRRLSRKMPNRPGAMRGGCIRRLGIKTLIKIKLYLIFNKIKKMFSPCLVSIVLLGEHFFYILLKRT